MVAARPSLNGNPGGILSRAWIWLFSSTNRAIAYAGGKAQCRIMGLSTVAAGCNADVGEHAASPSGMSDGLGLGRVLAYHLSPIDRAWPIRVVFDHSYNYGSCYDQSGRSDSYYFISTLFGGHPLRQRLFRNGPPRTFEIRFSRGYLCLVDRFGLGHAYPSMAFRRFGSAQNMYERFETRRTSASCSIATAIMVIMSRTASAQPCRPS